MADQQLVSGGPTVAMDASRLRGRKLQAKCPVPALRRKLSGSKDHISLAPGLRFADVLIAGRTFPAHDVCEESSNS